MQKYYSILVEFYIFIKRTVSYYRGFYLRLVYILFLILFTQAYNLLPPYIYGRIINDISSSFGTHSFPTLTIKLLGLIFIVNIFDELFSFYRSKYLIKNINFDARIKARLSILDSFLKFSVGQHKNHNSGISAEIIGNGESAISDFTKTMFFNVLPLVLKFFVTITVFFFVSPKIAFIVVIGSLIYLFQILRMKHKYAKDLDKREDLANESGRSRREITDHASHIIMNAMESEAVSMHERAWNNFATFAKNLAVKLRLNNGFQNATLDLTDLIAFTIGLALIVKGEFTLGIFITTKFWWSGVINSFYSIGNYYDSITDDIVSINKLYKMLDKEVSVKELPDAIKVDLNGVIEFKNVSFSYKNDQLVFSEAEKNMAKANKEKANLNVQNNKSIKDVLKNVSFKINPNERVAFVGYSGAGKTTLINLLLRSYDPDSGEILIDGVNLKNIAIKDFRQQVGLVDQVTYLFDDTIRNNLLFGIKDHGKVTDDDINIAIKSARLDDFIKNLPNGINTFIGKNGIKISGGERQRLSIARVLLKNPKLLILDEATSQLDVQNESLIKEAIENSSKNRTTIMIAHRLSTIRKADRIFVVHDNTVKESGNHNELMEKSEFYRNLVVTDMKK